MCGGFDSLQIPLPGNPKGFKRELKNIMLKNAVFQQAEKEVAVMDAGSGTGTASPLIGGSASDVPLWQPTLC